MSELFAESELSLSEILDKHGHQLSDIERDNSRNKIVYQYHLQTCERFSKTLATHWAIRRTLRRPSTAG
jgi:hypothetical protein